MTQHERGSPDSHLQAWLDGLADERAAARIATRIVRLRAGLLGDTKMLGGGVGELRIDYGLGYRVYFAQRGRTLVILLCGGDKRTQRQDIRAAKAMMADLVNINAYRDPSVRCGPVAHLA